MKRILVTTDFSEHSRVGIRFALQLAGQTGAAVIFCHVLKTRGAFTKQDSKLLTKKKDAALAQLTSLAEKISGKGNRNIEREYVCVAGYKVYDTVIETAQSLGADVICLSTRGAGRVKRLIGTTASALVLRSPVPLAVIPHNYAPKTIRRLFYATDMNNLPGETKIVKEVSQQLGATVTAYHYDYLLHSSNDTSILEKKVAKYRSPSFTFTFKKDEIDLNLSEHLTRDIKKSNADLVIIFTKLNRGWFERLFVGSEVENIAFHGKLPMLVYRKPCRVAKKSVQHVENGAPEKS